MPARLAPDALDLLRELRPPDPDISPDDAALERILRAGPEAAGPRPPRTGGPARGPRLRRPVRALALAAAVAAAISAGLLVAPDGGPERPGLVARAAAALSVPDTILHVRARITGESGRTREFESWETTDGLRERQVVDGGALELVRDRAAGTLTGYARDRDLVQTINLPPGDGTRPRGIAGAAGFSGVAAVGDLRALLKRAADGRDAGVQLLGQTDLDGRRVTQVQISEKRPRVDDQGAPILAADGSAVTATLVRDVYLDPSSALPVRVVDRSLRPAVLPDRVIDFLKAETLPRTASNEALLNMAPHPGAAQRTETIGG